MKRFLFAVVIAALVGTAGMAMAEDRMEEIEAAEQHIRLRHEQLELENAERQMEYEQALRGMELMERRQALEGQQGRQARCPVGSCVKGRHPRVLMLICGVVNVLLAVWVFQDIRARQAGSGLWIVITLLAGFFGAVIYAIVRLGDAQKSA